MLKNLLEKHHNLHQENSSRQSNNNQEKIQSNMMMNKGCIYIYIYILKSQVEKERIRNPLTK